jgi:hypothetical protein
MTSSDLLPRAEASLRDAIMSGSEKRIDAAGARLVRARDAEARRTQRARDREAARLVVAAERRDTEREAKKAAADRIERELRKREPYVVVHANGKVIRIRLAHEDPLGRGTAVEAARRVVYMATHRFQDMVVASRGALARVEQRDWIAELEGNTAGLLPAQRMDLVRIEDDAAVRG